MNRQTTNRPHRTRPAALAARGAAILSLLAALVAADATEPAAIGIARRSYGGSEATRIVGRSVVSPSRPASAARAVAAKAPVRPGRGTRLDAVRLERTERYAALIEHHSRLNNVDVELVKAIVYTESGGDAHALSSQGARGLMQLMPATAAELGVKDPTNPHESIASGTRYLRDMLDKFGSTELALWAYNAGPGAVERGRLPAETQDYVPRVLAVRKAMRSLGQVPR